MTDGFVVAGHAEFSKACIQRVLRYRAAVVAGPSSLLAYTDIHSYPVNDPFLPPYTVAQALASVELSSIDSSAKPLWLGEFGAFNSTYSSASIAAAAMFNHKNAMVQSGFRAWGFWTWDENVPGVLYNATDGNRAIDQQLAPSLNGF